MVSALEKQKCVTGKQCGSACIPKKYTCNANKKGAKPKQRSLKSSRPKGVVKKADFPTISLMSVAGAAAGVGALGAGVAIAGVAKKAAWDNARKQYRQRLDENASRIPEMSRQVQAPKLPDDTKSMIFSVGGFGTADALSESQKLSDLLVEEGIDKGVHHEPFGYSDFNVPTSVDENTPPKKVAQAVKEAAQLFKKTFFDEKENKAGIRLAAQVMAYQDANPHVKNVGIISHSGGGYVSAEAEHLLRKNGRDVKVMSIGTPDWDIYDKSPNIKTAVCDKDEIVNATSKKVLNGIRFGGADGHGIANYAKDPNFRAFVKDYFSFSESSRSDSKKLKCKKGKPCGSACIPKQNECRDGKVPPKKRLSASRKSGKAKQNQLKSGESSPSGKQIVNAALIAAATVAGTAAVSAGAYHGIRASYRAQYGKSAKEAERRSKEIDWNTLPDYKGKEGGYLLMPGYSAALGDTIATRAENIMREEVKDFIPEDTHPSHLIYNKKFNIGKDLKDVGKEDPSIDVDNLQLKDIAELGKKHLKGKEVLTLARNVATSLTEPVLMKGRNEQAIDTAAMLMAMRDKYKSQNDGKEPNFKAVGVSAGGIYGADADMILKKAGMEVDMLFFGSPYLGIADPKPDNIVRIFSSNDFLVGKLSGGDAAYFNHVTNHTGYQKDPEVQELIRDFIQNGAKDTRDKFYGDRTYKKEQQKAKNQKRQNSIARFDQALKKPNCKKGKPCTSQTGTTVCIPKNYTCRDQKSAKSPRQISLKSGKAIGGKLEAKKLERLEEEKDKRAAYDTNPKTGKTYTIRELKEIAREKELGGYSELNTEQLKRRLVEYDEADEEAKITYKKRSVSGGRGLTKRQIAASFSGKGKASKAGREAAMEANQFWKNMETLAKFAGAKPVSVGMAAVGAYAAGVTLKKYDELKTKYTSNFKEQSDEVFEKAAVLSKSRGRRVRPQNEEGNNITFVVANTDRESQDMVDTLVGIGKSENAKTEDEWLAELGFAKFTNKEAGFRTTDDPIVNATNSLKQYAQNIKRGKDQDAVDLAAQIYAYATEVDPVDKQTRLRQGIKKNQEEKAGIGNALTVETKRRKDRAQILQASEKTAREIEEDEEMINIQIAIDDLRTRKREYTDEIIKMQRSLKNIDNEPPIYEFRNKDKKINILADHNSHSVKTAMEILQKLEPPKGSGFPPGPKVLEQLNVVMLGTPHYGFTEKRAAQQRTIISAQDPRAKLPIFGDGGRQQWISSARGSEMNQATNYLKDEHVREALREVYGFSGDSNAERLRRGGRVSNQRSRFNSQIRVDDRCPPNKHWVKDDRVKLGGYCRSGGYERKKLAARLGRGNVAGAIGGLGNDIERTYIRSRRLKKKFDERKQQKTFKNKAKEELTFQGKQLGIIAGKGTVSQALRKLDEKLIDFSEDADNLKDTIKNFIDSTADAIAKAIGFDRKKQQGGGEANA